MWTSTELWTGWITLELARLKYYNGMSNNLPLPLKRKSDHATSRCPQTPLAPNKRTASYTEILTNTSALLLTLYDWVKTRRNIIDYTTPLGHTWPTRHFSTNLIACCLHQLFCSWKLSKRNEQSCSVGLGTTQQTRTEPVGHVACAKRVVERSRMRGARKVVGCIALLGLEIEVENVLLESCKGNGRREKGIYMPLLGDTGRSTKISDGEGQITQGNHLWCPRHPVICSRPAYF